MGLETWFLEYLDSTSDDEDRDFRVAKILFNKVTQRSDCDVAVHDVCAPKFHTFPSVRLSGLSLVLYIEDYNYVPRISENVGAVVSVHPYGTMSFPEINGLGLLPGETTFIALKQVRAPPTSALCGRDLTATRMVSLLVRLCERDCGFFWSV